MFDFLATATAIASPKDALERANFAVQNKLAKFLASGSRVIALRDKTTAFDLKEKGDALLSEITAIQTRSFGVMGEAKTLQDKMAAGINLADVKSGAGVAKELLEINAAMDAHMGKVDAYAREVAGGPVVATIKPFPWTLVAAGACVVAVILYLRRRK